jgi:methylated-DNA-[protein]-cysteine S-methyltransferase
MFSTFSTDLGFMALATFDGEVVGLAFGHAAAGGAKKSLEKFHARQDARQLNRALQETAGHDSVFHNRVVQLLERFAAGEEVDFDDVPIDMAGMTDFQKRVVAVCRAIPWGETVSYGELAAQVGHAGAARAVGTVMRKNRVPLIVPCHRVLASGGSLGGYSAPAGLAMKRRLLELEGRNQLLFAH